MVTFGFPAISAGGAAAGTARNQGRLSTTALELLEEAGTAGNLTTDAELAAYALENDAEMHSCDTDFARFAGLTWINPLTAAAR